METLRIHFGREDLTRVRLAAGYDAMWELVLSVHQIAFPAQRTPFFAGWRRRAGGTVSAEGLEPVVRGLARLGPAAAYFPDFLTPAGQRSCVGEGLEAVLSTPVARIRAEVGKLAALHRRPPSWFGDLADGRPGALDRLGRAVRRYHDAVLAPYERELAAAVGADLAGRTRELAAGGVERLLAGLHPSARWRSPVLSVDYAVDADLHLNGRGLLLIPTLFGVHNLITLADRDQAPVLVYPVRREALWELPDGAQGRLDVLSDLLGPTRAAALNVVDEGLTTTALAGALGVSPSAASRHATALRKAGLIRTVRRGQRVLHSRTRLGEALFRGDSG
ncbi:ArsR/SmtB family transcription factor [Nonomuraea zeae]|uniref:Winged helix-turn-helix transcriptional regulator n=1 Tax=Nonomuraea zeae TaxID=1642303 RepID=A0A5S4GLN6_9ACTN|nr:winged helix-turn-helix domain-containing protein [Nonomuraea zeae]TMR33793.1 winged helix-turn-helix transcriptional regulator [Nonomuraea zeae]